MLPMPSHTFKTLAVGIIILAVFYQCYLADFLFISLGLFRGLQPIEDFPYTCRPIRHEYLEGCEDIWLDEEGRTLYAACSSAYSRTQWCPSMNKFNISGRKPGGDLISVLNIDSPSDDGLFGLRPLKSVEYAGGWEAGELSLHGFDVEILDDRTLRFWMINHQPPIDGSNGGTTVADAYERGANSMVELFDVIRGGEEMKHVKTIANEAIDTPNNLAGTGDGGVFITNDHSAKAHQIQRRRLDPFIGGGSIAHCTFSSCHIAASSGFNHPNGMVKGKDSLYYIPSSFIDKIRVMRLGPNLTLTEVHIIHVGMPIDNLSVDQTGDIYAAAFPKILKVMRAFQDPYGKGFPSTIWRIRRLGLGMDYEVKKILEDGEARVLQGATVARHDSKTGRLFMGGVIAQSITVCEPHREQLS